LRRASDAGSLGRVSQRRAHGPVGAHGVADRAQAVGRDGAQRTAARIFRVDHVGTARERGARLARIHNAYQ